MNHFVDHNRAITAITFALTRRARSRMQAMYESVVKTAGQPADIDFSSADAINDFLDGDAYLRTLASISGGLNPMLEAVHAKGVIRIRLYKLHDEPLTTTGDLIKGIQSPYQAIAATLRAVAEMELTGFEYAQGLDQK